MTNEKVLEIIKMYRMVFEERKTPKFQFRLDDKPKSTIDMLGQMEVFVNEGNIEKAMRWLGFIQGVLWAQGIYTVHELRHHNM